MDKLSKQTLGEATYDDESEEEETIKVQEDPLTK